MTVWSRRDILELARREAILIDVGKQGFGPSTAQDDINALIVEHAQSGAQVVRLKGGDPTVFGRLDEEIDAVSAAGHRLARGARYHRRLGLGRRDWSKPHQTRAQFGHSHAHRARYERLCRS